MTIQTTYGYKIPELEDKDFWTSYNENFVLVDAHNHDGDNSAVVAPQATLDPTVGSGQPAGLDGELRYKIVSNEVKLFLYSPGEADWLEVGL